jgi:putative ABC transport system ATP-binding protein
VNFILEGRDLEKTYEVDSVVQEAVGGVNIAVAPGEFVAIMGPSGSGKSTLLHILAGLDRPSWGEVYLEGTRVDELSETEWARVRRHRIGFVFQFFNLINSMTVAENVELPGLVAGLGSREARRRSDELLNSLGLADKADVTPSKLSGGEQQRVAIARALINRPAILLADEPTGNLDSQTSRETLDVLRGFHDGGQTILMVTHDALVAAAADRVLSMRDGEIVDEIRLEPGTSSRTLLSRLIDLEV